MLLLAILCKQVIIFIHYYYLLLLSLLSSLLIFFSLFIIHSFFNKENAFVALALINSVRFPMGLLPNGVRCIAEGRVAANRIKRFLLKDELLPRQPLIPLSDLPPDSPVVGIFFF